MRRRKCPTHNAVTAAAGLLIGLGCFPSGAAAQGPPREARSEPVTVRFDPALRAGQLHEAQVRGLGGRPQLETSLKTHHLSGLLQARPGTLAERRVADALGVAPLASGVHDLRLVWVRGDGPDGAGGLLHLADGYGWVDRPSKGNFERQIPLGSVRVERAFPDAAFRELEEKGPSADTHAREEVGQQYAELLRSIRPGDVMRAEVPPLVHGERSDGRLAHVWWVTSFPNFEWWRPELRREAGEWRRMEKLPFPTRIVERLQAAGLVGNDIDLDAITNGQSWMIATHTPTGVRAVPEDQQGHLFGQRVGFLGPHEVELAITPAIDGEGFMETPRRDGSTYLPPAVLARRALASITFDMEHAARGGPLGALGYVDPHRGWDNPLVHAISGDLGDHVPRASFRAGGVIDQVTRAAAGRHLSPEDEEKMRSSVLRY